MENISYDLVILGAGPGGYVAAIRAAQLGLRVACVEKSQPGGTCLNRGCIPSKALLDSSELYYQAGSSFKRHGITTGELSCDLTAMMKRKDRIVTTMNRGIQSLFKKHNITSITGVGRLESTNSVSVETPDGATTLSAERILLATGSMPQALPGAPWGERIISSTEALTLAAVPEKLLVVGAGAIGLELGSVWSRLGSEVQVIEMLNSVMPGMDQDITAPLQKALQKQGLKFHLETRVERVQTTDSSVEITTQNSTGTSEFSADYLLVAIGRAPCTEGLGLDTAGVELNDQGRIPVGADFQTNISGIYAIGDVTPGPMLAHRAEEEGIAAVESMTGHPKLQHATLIPGVVYTDPEAAAVGLTEAQAKEQGLNYQCGSFPFIANGRARCLQATDGLVKVISETDTDRILGVHILGPRASDLIAEAVLAMRTGATALEVGETIHAHPTLPEVFKEAALAVHGRAIHI